MGPVEKILNSIRAKAKKHQSFKLLLEECPAYHKDLLLHTDWRWLCPDKILQCFLSLLREIKTFTESRGEDATLLMNAERLLDLTFLRDVTDKINQLNMELQGKDKHVSDMIRSVSALSSQTDIVHSAS